jgi:hypothetical protein
MLLSCFLESPFLDFPPFFAFCSAFVDELVPFLLLLSSFEGIVLFSLLDVFWLLLLLLLLDPLIPFDDDFPVASAGGASCSFALFVDFLDWPFVEAELLLVESECPFSFL